MHNITSYTTASESLSKREKIGQLFMPAAFINDTEEEICALEKLIKEQGIGGLCFFHSRASAATNFEGKKKIIVNTESLSTLKNLIQRYQKAAKQPLLISIDAEWGLAMRIENTPQYPYAICLGAMQNGLDLIEQVGKNIALDCKNAGIHWNLAPVVDINNNPNNPVIGYRSFGEDKNNVTENAIAFIKGTKEAGILTSIKHFPGHGDTATDSHLDLPLIDKNIDELWDNELYPFRKIVASGVDSVMIGHLSIPALANGSKISSSISKDIIKGVLRTELSFKGVVISDALNMHAVSKNYPIKGELEWLAFDAGNDILCFAENTVEGIETILKNANNKAIEESFKRIWLLKEKAINQIDNHKLQAVDYTTLLTKIAKKSITQIVGNTNNFMNAPFVGIDINFKEENTFFTTIKKEKDFDFYNLSDTSIPEIKAKIKDKENILLSIEAPKVKPQNKFNIPKEYWALIGELLETKNVILYIFGSPFILNHLNYKNTKSAVVAYQDFEEFKTVAANHFLGKINAEGKLPVTIS
ncbi:beta-glucosidase-like glycosyl hydrolase [Maribacter vaceletii]|uniref:beta-N-acetylhexosaminidase n=1 Tax=Maribacter vaceletii TaxID=1206816 RepID=A0A495DSK3_9FLAO|nr:glycoside hydrolase family 3 N-terminal domain-containing protein [Maribacter vaceletii]RKR07139.1 beta-glucosidase-like glycosyl hydrolase [Maribacter vaceletii]